MAKVRQRWTDQEFAGLDLGDARLNKRARTLMERFAAKPTASIPQACDNWSETCAAYRFLGNDDVSWEGILAPHWERTRQRMGEHPVVLCIQDTTELDFNGQEAEGLGPLNYEARRGMYLHPTYAVTPGRMTVTCVVAREIGAPKGVKPIEWRLLTNREATTFEQAVELIAWYRCRWEIEIYFNVLKNGCEVEALQLSAIDRIEQALALFMVVAWRVTYLMRKGRTCPELDARLFFDPDEIRGANLLTKKKMPAKPASVNEVVRLIAQVGGSVGRKSDGEPGAKTIWRGLDQVHAAAETLRALREGLG